MYLFDQYECIIEKSFNLKTTFNTILHFKLNV